MKPGKTIGKVLLASVFLFASIAERGAVAASFFDPLNVPARTVAQVNDRPLMAVARSDSRLVAVGLRGLVIVSTDNGKTWRQAAVPVQSDLLAVNFASAQEGWIVGHDGVILHSGDGGMHWEKQLDGRLAADHFPAYYRDLGAAGATYLTQLQRDYKAGPALPFLDVWFEDESHGYAVGSFGMLAATEDGGKTWQPWLHRIDNPEFLNLNAIRAVDGQLYIAGERGQLYRLDRTQRRFVRMDTGYLGSFFGIVGNDKVLIAYGLRGTVYRATPTKDGNLVWHPLSMPTDQTLTAGIAEGSQRFLLGDMGGRLVELDALGQAPKLLPTGPALRITGAAALDPQHLLVTSLEGLRTITLPSNVAQR